MQFTSIQHRTHKTQVGLAAIEFVFILAWLLVLGFGVIDFGRLLFQYDTLTKSTRDATRYLAAVVKPAVTDTNYTTAENNATNLAVCGTIAACGSNPLVDGLTASNIAIDYPASVGNITYVRIRVENYSTSYITNVLGVSKDLGIISVTMRQVWQ